MKIVAISDTHGNVFQDKIPECDLLIHAGDISPARDHNYHFQKQWFTDVFVPSLSLCPAKHIIFVGGNHDFYLHELYKNNDEKSFRDILPENVTYLRDSTVNINGLKIHGIPWVTNLRNWAFNLKNEDEEFDRYQYIPSGLDILVSHAPANSYCDTILEYNETENLGSKTLKFQIHNKKPKLVLTGHIHSANHNIEKIMVENVDINFRCVSIVDESYSIHYKPFVFEYDEQKGFVYE
jgi:Icc-related predicted phosphoesterase